MGTKLSATEGLRIVANRAGKSMAQISREMGYKMPTNITNMMSRGSMRMDVGAGFAECCGYKMVLVPVEVDVSEVDGIEIKGEVPNQGE